MPSSIQFTEDIEVRERRVRRARHLRLSIDGSGRVLLTRPFWVSKKAALSFLEEKRTWLEDRWRELSTRPESNFRRGGRAEYLRDKEATRALVVDRLKYFNQFYNYKISRIAIRDQRTRWGSCSKSGGLNFNYRLLHLPPELADYVILHELCHLGELNHSYAFWALMQKVMPDYLQRRRTLRHG
ncbi:MAG: M48 family metallopeptidase [bacterium]|nr:M48 family metallopeptidase [bacterium]